MGFMRETLAEILVLKNTWISTKFEHVHCLGGHYIIYLDDCIIADRLIHNDVTLL